MDKIATMRKSELLISEKQVFSNSQFEEEMCGVILEDDSAMKVCEKHSVYVSFGNILYPDIPKTNNFPLNSFWRTIENNLFSAENMDSISGGCIRINTIPRYFSGGNLNMSPKCLSNVINTLLSEVAVDIICSSEVDCGADLTSCFSLINFTNLAGIFSSQRIFSLECSEEDLRIFVEKAALVERNISLSLEYLRGMNKRGKNGFFGEFGKIVFENLSYRNSCSKQFNNLPDHNSGAFESWLPMADFAVSDNVFVNFDSHDSMNINEIYKTFGLSKVNVYEVKNEN